MLPHMTPHLVISGASVLRCGCHMLVCHGCCYFVSRPCLSAAGLLSHCRCSSITLAEEAKARVFVAVHDEALAEESPDCFCLECSDCCIVSLSRLSCRCSCGVCIFASIHLLEACLMLLCKPAATSILISASFTEKRI